MSYKETPPYLLASPSGLVKGTELKYVLEALEFYNKFNDTNSDQVKKLFELVFENPSLPIVPIVDGKIVGEDRGYWLGEWGSARVDEYLVTEKGVCFKSDDDVFYTLYRYLSDDEYEVLPDTEKECKPHYDKLPWRKAIIIYINAKL